MSSIAKEQNAPAAIPFMRLGVHHWPFAMIHQNEIRKQSDPKVEYQSRLQTKRNMAARMDLWHRRIGNIRLSVALVGVVLAWLSFKSGLFSPWWLIVPSSLFAGLIILHDRVRQSFRRLIRAAEYYERGISRLEDRWIGNGEPGTRFMNDHHPYATDLDLFGEGSVFELLCTARTNTGQHTLASWLKKPVPANQVRERQKAVEELKPRIDLREDLAVLGAEVRAAVDSESLSRWAVSPPVRFSAPIRAGAAALSMLAATTLILWGIEGSKIWYAMVAVLQAGFAWWLRPRVIRITRAADRPGTDLALIAQMMKRLEKENFQTSLLRNLRLGLNTQTDSPSKQIARLNRLIVLLDSRRNQLFAPIAAVLLWGTQFACAIEAWRIKSGPSVGKWLSAVGEIEALCAFAGYAYEHPADPFPEICEEIPVFSATGIAHPLLPESRGVRNDVVLSRDPEVLIVSGSNMSGKSTLLRTVGINTVLALAGAPVRAAALRLSPLAVGASIGISDSLQEGNSRFYAEIKRIRQIMDLTTESMPLLFLLDELLQGTNSHDRRIGAEAIIRTLVDRGAIGLVTTHDLALADIAENMSPRIQNVHFEDYIKNGRIAFDYRLRPGIVQRSNALELMRSVGLDV